MKCGSPTRLSGVAKCIGLCVLIAMAALAPGALAQTGQPTEQSGTRLTEDFGGFNNIFEPDGCSITHTSISFHRETRDPGGVTSLFASVFLQRGNTCTNEFTVFADGEISFVSMSMASNTKSARAVGEGTITNFIDGSSLNVFVDVSFVNPTETYKFSQPPTGGQPVHGTGAVGQYEGIISVDGENFLATEGAHDSRATLDRWIWLTG